VQWYFDFVSPFSYIQCRTLDRLPEGVELELKPVLFAAMLDHFGTVGPAEIAPKRLHTYRLCRWIAHAQGIPFTAPPAHPFNPLRALRLAVAIDAPRDPGLATVRAIFDFIWAEGRDVNDDAEFAELGRRFRIDDPLARISVPGVKDVVKRNTDAAIAAGVFGVPSFVAGGQVFWGVDATGMFLDYLANPALFSEAEMARYPTLPVGATRKR
jgi:2-hydroxychromene-2-carboxylate isomerase